jgi:glyoxylase-like metal-dependent hydrolase (beta-lactamase superfamily II)
MAATMPMTHATADSWYETQRLTDDVTLIFEPHMKPFYRCNIWHVRGRDRDLLVDSGMGVVSLSGHVSLVTERSLLAVATHTHWDHIGSHHEFAERAVHPLEAEILAAPTRESSGAGISVRSEKAEIFERAAGLSLPSLRVAPAAPRSCSMTAISSISATGIQVLPARPFAWQHPLGGCERPVFRRRRL